MINKCFITKITTPMENNSEEYLYSAKIQFSDWSDGNLLIGVNRAVDVSTEIINHSEASVTYEYSASNGHTIEVGYNVGSGYIIIKDMRNLFVTYMSAVGNYPNRRMEANTAMYANALLENARTISNYIMAFGKVISGHIIDFSKFIALSTLKIGSDTDANRFSYIEGSLEELAEGMISFGRTSGSLAITCNGIVTANGVAPVNGTVKTITFSGSTYSIA